MKIEKYKDLVESLDNLYFISNRGFAARTACLESELNMKRHIRSYIEQEEAREEKQEMEKEAALESASNALSDLEARCPGITLSLLRGMASKL